MDGWTADLLDAPAPCRTSTRRLHHCDLLDSCAAFRPPQERGAQSVRAPRTRETVAAIRLDARGRRTPGLGGASQGRHGPRCVLRRVMHGAVWAVCVSHLTALLRPCHLPCTGISADARIDREAGLPSHGVKQVSLLAHDTSVCGRLRSWGRGIGHVAPLDSRAVARQRFEVRLSNAERSSLAQVIKETRAGREAAERRRRERELKFGLGGDGAATTGTATEAPSPTAASVQDGEGGEGGTGGTGGTGSGQGSASMPPPPPPPPPKPKVSRVSAGGMGGRREPGNLA